MKRKATKKHITMIELLVVSVIIIVLAALTIQGYGDMKQRAQILKLKEQIFAIKLAASNYKKDFGQYPTVGSSETENIRPFKHIREALLGDNDKSIVYVNGDLVNPFQKNPNSQSYQNYQFMIAFDYNASGLIGDHSNSGGGGKGKGNSGGSNDNGNAGGNTDSGGNDKGNGGGSGGQSYAGRSYPDITDEDLHQGVIIWVKNPFGGYDIRSW